MASAPTAFDTDAMEHCSSPIGEFAEIKFRQETFAMVTVNAVK
jgi:hypothetical protein